MSQERGALPGLSAEGIDALLISSEQQLGAPGHAPPQSSQQQQQQQQWQFAAMRSAAATALAPGGTATLPPAGPVPTSGAAVAAAPPQQQAQQPQQPAQEQQPRRRGRKPIPLEQMTEKQLRTREQNQRFKQKQEAQMRETEATLEATSTQLEQERAHHQQELQTSMAYEQLVDYKGEMVEALQVAAELDPPPGISIPEEMLHVLAKEEVIEEFGWDMIMRYAVGGYEEHIGPSGWVVKAPPFEAVARDWADIANKMRAVLSEARVPRRRPAESTGSEGAATPTRREGRARESAPWEVQEVEQPDQGQAEGPEAASQGADPAAPPLPSRQQQQQQQEGGSAPSMPQGTSQPAVGEPAAAALGPSSSTVAAASAGDAAVAAGDKGPPNLAQLIAERDKLPPHRAELRGGMVVQDGDDTYRLTGAHVLQSSLLFRRIALICWQQAALFPDNANKLVSMNLETCAGYEEQELPRWRNVVRQMRFSPEELEKVVRLHKEYIAMLRPALLRRREALQRLRELHAEPTLTSQQDLMRKSLIASECNSTLMSSVHTLNAATGAMSAGLWKMLQFPLGIFKMVLMSWPYYPQLHMIGLAAAEELGLDMAVYTSFNELFVNLSEGGPAGGPFGTELWATGLVQG